MDAADVVAWLKVLGRGDVDHIANLMVTSDPSMLLVAVGCFLLPNLPYGMAMAAGPARIEAPRATAPISWGRRHRSHRDFARAVIVTAAILDARSGRARPSDEPADGWALSRPQRTVAVRVSL